MMNVLKVCVKGDITMMFWMGSQCSSTLDSYSQKDTPFLEIVEAAWEWERIHAASRHSRSCTGGPCFLKASGASRNCVQRLQKSILWSRFRGKGLVRPRAASDYPKISCTWQILGSAGNCRDSMRWPFDDSCGTRAEIEAQASPTRPLLWDPVPSSPGSYPHSSLKVY